MAVPACFKRRLWPEQGESIIPCLDRFMPAGTFSGVPTLTRPRFNWLTLRVNLDMDLPLPLLERTSYLRNPRWMWVGVEKAPGDEVAS